MPGLKELAFPQKLIFICFFGVGSHFYNCRLGKRTDPFKSCRRLERRQRKEKICGPVCFRDAIVDIRAVNAVNPALFPRLKRKIATPAIKVGPCVVPDREIPTSNLLSLLRHKRRADHSGATQKRLFQPFHLLAMAKGNKLRRHRPVRLARH